MTDGGSSSCSAFANDNTTCVDKGGGQCHCETSEVEQKPASTPNTYSTSGVNWSSESSSGTYCVSGDILYYRENKDTSLPLLYVLKRKQ
jgi:hypothetical protein